MAGTVLKFEDEYVNGTGKHILEQMTELDEGYSNYINIMKAIRDDGLMEGETATALEAYIEYASYLCTKIKCLGECVDTTCREFVDEVNEKDQYLF